MHPIKFCFYIEDNENKIRHSLEFVKNRLKTTLLHIRFDDEKRAEEELKLILKIFG